MKSVYVETLLVNYYIWPISQMVNFLFVPVDVSVNILIWVLVSSFGCQHHFSGLDHLLIFKGHDYIKKMKIKEAQNETEVKVEMESTVKEEKVETPAVEAPKEAEVEVPKEAAVEAPKEAEVAVSTEEQK